MNLQNIKNIIDSLLPQNVKRELIIKEIAQDKNVIPMILEMLHFERAESEDSINTLNLLLSKADVVLSSPQLNDDNFIQQEISEYYETSKKGHCFKQ